MSDPYCVVKAARGKLCPGETRRNVVGGCGRIIRPSPLDGPDNLCDATVALDDIVILFFFLPSLSLISMCLIYQRSRLTTLPVLQIRPGHQGQQPYDERRSAQMHE